MYDGRGRCRTHTHEDMCVCLRHHNKFESYDFHNMVQFVKEFFRNTDGGRYKKKTRRNLKLRLFIVIFIYGWPHLMCNKYFKNAYTTKLLEFKASNFPQPLKLIQDLSSSCVHLNTEQEMQCAVCCGRRNELVYATTLPISIINIIEKLARDPFTVRRDEAVAEPVALVQ